MSLLHERIRTMYIWSGNDTEGAIRISHGTIKVCSEEREAGTPLPEHVWAVYFDKARVRSSERQR